MLVPLGASLRCAGKEPWQPGGGRTVWLLLPCDSFPPPVRSVEATERQVLSLLRFGICRGQLLIGRLCLTRGDHGPFGLV